VILGGARVETGLKVMARVLCDPAGRFHLGYYYGVVVPYVCKAPYCGSEDQFSPVACARVAFVVFVACGGGVEAAACLAVVVGEGAVASAVVVACAVTVAFVVY
jgi:hypothetical protein